MVTDKLLVAMSFVFGILLMWLGGWTTLVTLPMAKGELKPREVNYRPWKPKFIREMKNEEIDKINLDGAKLMLVVTLSIFILGVCSIILGILGMCSIVFGGFTIFNPVIFLLLVGIGSPIVLLIIFVYLFIYKRKIRKAYQ
jgi:hypothetical protein